MEEGTQMDTNEVADHLGIHRKELTRFLRRVERALGVWKPNYRRAFTEKQADELRLAYWQSHNRRTGTTG